MKRWVLTGLIITTGVLALVSACSETARYRVLSFFLDGVPAPGTAPSGRGVSAPGGLGQAAESGVAPAAVSAPRRLHPHTPYRENRCGGCHDSQTGQLLTPVREGLCVTCHREVLGEARYVHGPVAVNECLLCHHHHAAALPKLLLQEATATCLQCHERGDLSEGEHHAGIGQRSCVECHDPHGGADRFFLKRTGR